MMPESLNFCYRNAYSICRPGLLATILHLLNPSFNVSSCDLRSLLLYLQAHDCFICNPDAFADPRLAVALLLVTERELSIIRH